MLEEHFALSSFVCWCLVGLWKIPKDLQSVFDCASVSALCMRQPPAHASVHLDSNVQGCNEQHSVVPCSSTAL